MTSTHPLDRAKQNATEIVSVLVTGIWLAALVADQSWWLAFMLFGYIVLVPVTALLFGDGDVMSEWWDSQWGDAAETEDGAANGKTEDDALATLRNRYARGELTDEQFERKLDRLLETETIEDVEDRGRNRISERE